jgi:5-(carboxyamino)imidazole ribonucleotide synthase
VMTNLLGDDIDTWQQAASQPNVAYHHYGKSEARAGRKMGHINRLLPLI